MRVESTRFLPVGGSCVASQRVRVGRRAGSAKKMAAQATALDRRPSRESWWRSSACSNAVTTKPKNFASRNTTKNAMYHYTEREISQRETAGPHRTQTLNVSYWLRLRLQGGAGDRWDAMLLCPPARSVPPPRKGGTQQFSDW
ncbi:unnamed protein product [Ectocarpus sp. 6 AP-2014]